MALSSRVALVALLALGSPLLASGAVTTKEIEEALTCQCGCGLTVHSCNHLQCGSGIPLKQEAAGLVAEGLDRDTILGRFQSKYGEKILAAPTTEGFNLTAWVLPFVMVGAGTGVILAAVRRWTARDAAAETSKPSELDAADRRRLEEALRRSDEE